MRDASTPVVLLATALLIQAALAVNPAFPELFAQLGKTKQHSIYRHCLAVVTPKGVFGFASAKVTMLAPTDEAFRGPKGLFKKLGITEAAFKKDPALIHLIVQYHTIPEVSITKLLAAAEATTGTKNPDSNWWLPTLRDWNSAETINGQNSPNNVRFFTRNRGTKVFRSAASAAVAKIPFDKVDIFSLDTVLIPSLSNYKNCKSVASLLAGNKHLTAFIKVAGLYPTLAAKSFGGTVFAPTDKAIAAYAQKMGTSVSALLADRTTLPSVIKFHVLTTRRYQSNFFSNTPLPTLLKGKSLSALVSEGTTTTTIKIRGGSSAATLIGYDMFACKAVVHPIDNILIP